MQRRQRQRTVKPSMLADERLTSVPFALRWFALLMQFWADDEGRAELLPRQMVRALFASDPQVTPDRVEELVLELDAVGYLHVYADEDGRTLFQIASDLLGTVDKRNRSDLPPPVFANDFANRFANPGLGREGARERVTFASAGESDDEGDEGKWLPPSAFCADHPGGTRKRCPHCGTARLRQKEWENRRRAGKSTSHLEGVRDEFDDWDLSSF